MKKLVLVPVLLSAGIAFAGEAPKADAKAAPAPAKIDATSATPATPATAAKDAKKVDVVDTAVAAGKFGKLAEALKTAGMIETLKANGPYTVFAPSDDAFAKMSKSDFDALMKDKVKLKALLENHVVSGKIMAKDVKAGKLKTLSGKEIDVASTKDGKWSFGGAMITGTDVEASNGTIHVIDTVVVSK